MFAELFLTDGETKIDLLGANRNGVGIALTSMTLSRPQREPSGAFRQVYGAVNESYELKITDRGHNAVAARQQQLDRLLEQAANYFTSNVEDGLVWMCARTADESNPRYALVYGGMVESYGDVYNQPFTGNNGLSTINEITLVLERSTWQANPPSEPECVAITNSVDWNPNTPAWASVRSLTNVRSLFVTITGTILAGAANIERSTDNGSAWTVELTSGASTLRFWQFAHASTRIWAVAGVASGSAVSASGIYYSDDDGDTWTQHTASVDFYSVVYRPADNTVFFGGEGEVRYITAGGALTVLSTAPVEDVRAMVLTQTGAITVGDGYTTWRIPAGAFILDVTEAEDIGPFLQMLAVDDYLLLVSATYLSISRDDGLTWSIYWREWGADALYLMDDGDLLASKSGSVLTYISADGGFSWQTFANNFGSPSVTAWVEKGNDYLFAAIANTISRRISTNEVVAYGPFEPNCNTPSYVANHRLESNWTHIFIFDSSASTYTTVTPADVATNLANDTDQLCFPSPVGTNDIMYIGISTALADAGPFSNLYLELTEHNYTLTLAFEYWNGIAWTALTTNEMQDNTRSLKRSGVIVWSDIDMRSTAINSITAYWIRIKVTATGSLSTLLPKFRNIYIVQHPYIELDNLAGDIPSLGQIHLFNRLDDGNSLPQQPTDRVIMGLRNVERGERFTAFLNLAQKQNPLGASISIGADSAFVTDTITAAAGELIRYTPVTLNSYDARATVTLVNNLARDFAGTYQIYLRYAYSSFDDIVSARLKLQNFTPQDPIVGDEKPIVVLGNVGDFGQLVYLGQFSILPDRYLNSSDLSAQTTLTVELKSTTAGGTYAVDMFELILIPADEWIGEFTDPSASGYGSAGIERYVDVDSATFPKRVLRSTIRKQGSALVNSIWQSSASGAFILQPAQQQRLWIVTESWNQDNEYRPSPHTLVHQVKLYHHARWLGLRGND